MVKLYTNHCPQCVILENKLLQHSVDFTVCDDINEMKQAGIQYTPTLCVDGKLFSMSEAWKWIDALGGKNGN